MSAEYLVLALLEWVGIPLVVLKLWVLFAMLVLLRVLGQLKSKLLMAMPLLSCFGLLAALDLLRFPLRALLLLLKMLGLLKILWMYLLEAFELQWNFREAALRALHRCGNALLENT